MIFNNAIVVLAADAAPDLLPAREQMAGFRGAGGGEQYDGTLRDPRGPISAAHPTRALFGMTTNTERSTDEYRQQRLSQTKR
jgi:hypothetical protein